MRLKRLELIGFKSFANKVTLEFDQGITAIVGPNGSGKSNISDAVRWVLGEQSIKSLRGSKLEDVIFAGSDGRRPLGMAEVQLTLENSDGFLPIEYNEVTITRRVYRSGDSDFLINKHPCRLRDIQDLFTDTGLGREGYAIIGQGQIDAVLSNNPEERRILFEETAGIIKYRQRKEKAIKKMEQTDQDLVRIEDILSELNKQLGPLEAEANKARQYQTLANELFEAELDLYSLIINGLAQKETQLNQSLLVKREVGDKLANEYQQVESELNYDQELLGKKENELDALQQQIIDLNDKINGAIRNIELAEERLKHVNNQKHVLNNSHAEYLEQIIKLEKSCQSTMAELEIAQESYGISLSQLEVNETKITHLRQTFQEQRSQLEEKKSNFLEFIRELADARNFSRNYQQQRENLEYQTTTLSREESELVAQLEDVCLKLKELEENIILATESQAKHESQLVENNKLVAKFSADLNNINNQQQTLLAQYQQLKSRITALQELEDDFEGYNFSVRQLLKQPIPGITIHGTVGSVIKAPAGLENAIEIALGFGLQNIITPTTEDAKLAITWLKNQKAGRATFLPLDSIKSATFPADYQKYWEIPGCLGPAVELVEFEPIYQPAITALLGRIIIVEDLDTALKLRSLVPSFSRIVTKAGDVVMPNGSLTGGSINSKTTGLLARKTQIEKLVLQLKEVEKQVEAISHKKDAKSIMLEESQIKLEQSNEYGYQLKLQVQKLNNELEQLNLDKARLKHQHLNKKNQLQDLNNTIAELEDQSACAQKNIANLEKEELLKRQEITDLENNLVCLEATIEQANEELTQEKIDLTSSQGILNELKTELTNEKVQLDRIRQQLDKTEMEQDSLTLQKKGLANGLETNKNQHQEYLAAKSLTMEKLSDIREQRILLQGKIKANNEVLKKQRVALGKVDKEIYNIEFELNGINLELERITEGLGERHQTITDVQMREVDREQFQLEPLVQELKDKIRLLGIVNLGSLQEYESVKERSFFLQSQLEDVKKAKEALFDVINEMDSVSSERFIATYDQLRTEFKIVFKELFKGGIADIVLVDPADPLNTGIEIIAQPPGKKLQNLSLLSGGERSLTAIALLLAIRRVKPTPFCILDEVDAALDEANLDRFADILQGFAKSTQFLIITHRQATMEKADRLYGVTMGESATSQLISVKL